MNLEGHLDVDARDDEVAFALTVSNVGNEQVTLEFSDAQTADFAVLEDGQEVWRYSDGRMFAQMVQHDTVAPGDSVTYEGVWEDPTPGDYEVVATLEANDADVEVRRSLDV